MESTNTNSDQQTNNNNIPIYISICVTLCALCIPLGIFIYNMYWRSLRIKVVSQALDMGQTGVAAATLW